MARRFAFTAATIGLAALAAPAIAFAKDFAGPMPGQAVENAAAAVPEPATWAMMLVGFGLIGGLLRAARRRARPA